MSEDKTPEAARAATDRHPPNPADSTPAPDPNRESEHAVSRRSFMKGASLTIAAAGITGAAPLVAAPSRSADPKLVGPDPVSVTLTLNGKKTQLSVAPHATLLDTVRDQLGLTGSKRVCDRGFCGACSMKIDGRLANSCSFLAIDADGKTVDTIEGVSGTDNLSPLQEAFVECDALQCGFCTPGMVVACEHLLAENPNPTRDEIAQAISGNICRCGTYQNIFEAVEKTAKQGKKGGTRGRF